ncbi:MAG: aminotransferase class I/II-fold pyridoxal phosphate-dependent enzyme [Acutalibacteraceae bacterium]
MEYSQAKRLDHYQTGIFAALNAKKDALIAEGRKVYNLSVGTPDFPPPAHIKNALIDACRLDENYKYSLADLPELAEAVCDYYRSRFGVCDLNPSEVTAVHGTQEGMGHLGISLCNPGDIVLLPNPGYPAFEAGAYFGEAEIYYYPLLRENAFLPQMQDIPEDVLSRTKYMVVSYPSNPVCAVAPRSMYEELVRYAKKYGFIIINDNAYSDIIYDGHESLSFLSVEGAKEVGAEFFSLSKSYNVTGARISFLVGNQSVVNALKLMRSQIDFGMFYPVQYAAIAALRGPRDSVEAQRLEYQRRRDAFCGGLRSIGWDVPDSQGTMFVFAPLPPKFRSSVEFCEELMERTGVICTPGTSFGSLGEGYVRFALVKTPEEFREIVRVIDESGILR